MSKTIDHFKGQTFEHGYAVRFLYRLVRCGRQNCTKFHGPYLYKRISQRIGRRRVQRRELYIGACGSAAEQAILREKLAAEAHAERPEEEEQQPEGGGGDE
jgi:hypothetical protein